MHIIYEACRTNNHLGGQILYRSLYPSKKRRHTFIALQNKSVFFSEECSRETDLSSLLYVVYSLEFCSFVQGLWPLDASTVRYLLSQIIKPDDEVDKFNRIPDVYAKRNSGKKTGSVILNRSSNNHPSTSDVSTATQDFWANFAHFWLNFGEISWVDELCVPLVNDLETFFVFEKTVPVWKNVLFLESQIWTISFFALFYRSVPIIQTYFSVYFIREKFYIKKIRKSAPLWGRTLYQKKILN